MFAEDTTSPSYRNASPFLTVLPPPPSSQPLPGSPLPLPLPSSSPSLAKYRPLPLPPTPNSSPSVPPIPPTHSRCDLSHTEKATLNTLQQHLSYVSELFPTQVHSQRESIEKTMNTIEINLNFLKKNTIYLDEDNQKIIKKGETLLKEWKSFCQNNPTKGESSFDKLCDQISNSEATQVATTVVSVAFKLLNRFTP